MTRPPSTSTRLWAILLGLLLPMLASAARADLRLDAETIEQGQAIGVTVTVQGAEPQGIPNLTVPDGLRAAYTGQGSQMTMANGRITSFVRFSFEVSSTRTGRFNIGPAVVRILQGGKASTLRTGTAILTVSEAREDASGAPVEVTSRFDTSEAWQGQVVLFEYSLRSRREIAGGRWFGQPKEGLLIPRDGQASRREYQVQDALGSIQVDETIQPFVVTRTGDQHWDAPSLELDLVAEGGRRRGIFGLMQRTQRYAFMGQDLDMRVRPLPEPPEGYSGLVGDFELHARLSTRKARVGESVTWTLELIGDGTVEGMSLPPPPELEGVRIYEGGSRARAGVRNGRYRSAITYERTLVPTREGRIELPPLEIITFSPTEGTWKILRTAPPAIRVLPGEDGEVELLSFAPEPGLFDAEPVDDGMRPMWTSGRDTRLPALEAMPWLLLGASAPGLLLLGAAGARRVQRELETRRAASDGPRDATPLEILADLDQARDGVLAALDTALRMALHRKTGVDLSALHTEALDAALHAELLQEVRGIQSSLNRAQFADIAPPDDLRERVVAIVQQLEAP